MKKKVFLSGGRALAEGAIFAGCRYYYGAPRIINNEILKYMSTRLPEVNGIFVQAENERSAIGMVLGSSVSGAKVFTSTTTEGISSLEEGFSSLCGMELPCVICNIMTGRFGLRNFQPTQAGYMHSVGGGSTGGYKFIVLAPHSVQECYELGIKAFELADKYRNPVMVILDSALAQLTEVIEIEKDLQPPDKDDKKSWKLSGSKGRESKVFKSYHPDGSEIYKNIFGKFKALENETFIESFMIDDAEEIVISFGLTAKILKGYIIDAREKGRKIGLFRPISLSPFPKQLLKKVSEKADKIIVVEANTGAMYLDIVNIVDKKVSFFGESEELIGFRNIIKGFEKGLFSVWN